MSEVLVLQRKARHSLDELALIATPALEAAGVHRAIAFGSYARGQADGYADLDLVVVLPTELGRLQRGRLLTELVETLPVAVDLLIYTPEEYSRGIEKGLGVFDALAREGRTIYARSES